MANYLIARIENYKMHDVSGVGKEQERDKDYIEKYYKNEEHNIDKMCDNVTLVHDTDRDGKTWEQYITDYHKEHLSGRLTTKGCDKSQTNVATQFMITASREYFEDMSKGEQTRFFRDALKSIQEQYPSYHWVEVTIHYDETTPHMHALCLPIYRDNEKDRMIFSTTKTQCGREHYREFQDRLHSDMTKKYGYALERGVRGSDREHLSVKAFKELKAREKQLEKDKANFEREKDMYKAPVMEKTLLGNRYSKEDVEKVVEERNRAYVQIEKLYEQLADKQRDISYLCRQLDDKEQSLEFYDKMYNSKEMLIERVREIRELEKPPFDIEHYREFQDR